MSSVASFCNRSSVVLPSERGSFFKHTIEHPASRISAPETISIAGKSSHATELEKLADVASEVSGTVVKRKSANTRSVAGSQLAKSIVSASGSRVSRPETLTRITVDEIEALLKVKLKGGGYHELQNSWKNNDADGRGYVNRDVFRIMVSKLLNREISTRQVELLLQRLHCSHKTQFQFNDIYGYFRKQKTPGLPQWLTPRDEMASTVSNQKLENTTSVNAWRILKTNWGTLKDLLDVDFVSNSIIKDEFREFLARRFDIFSTDAEFNKLWDRIDLDGFKAVKADILKKRIAGPHRPFTGKQADIPKDKKASKDNEELVVDYEKDEQTNVDIEKWLKSKFREGFKDLQNSMKDYDADESGRMNRKDFKTVLGKYGLLLRDDHSLNSLLSRCGILESGPVNYIKFLERFQDRSDQGMTYELLKRKEKRIINRSDTPCSTVTVIESKLLSMLQSDYLSLVAAFHKLDRDNKDVVTQSEFQALLESRFGLEMDRTEFEDLKNKLPLDKKGNVKYPEFLATFDAGRFENKSLYEAQTDYSSASKNVVHKPRSVDKLNCVIKAVLNDNLVLVTKIFTEIDLLNHGWLTVETLYQLLLKCDVNPGINREECRKIWPQFRLNAKNTLNWHEFLRHYMYDQNTAAYPSAKHAPPRKGDDDYNRRSNKLNGVQCLLKDSARQMLEWKFDDFQEKFLNLDPFRTGFVTKQEFCQILKDIEDRLESIDLEEISVAYDTNKDDRVNYVEFLRPFVTRRLKSRKVAEETTQIIVPAEVSDCRGYTEVGQLVDKLVEKDVSAMIARREFKRCDTKNHGRVVISDFKTVSRRLGVSLNSEDVYKLATVLDPNCTGYIPYSDIIQVLSKRKKN